VLVPQTLNCRVSDACIDASCAQKCWRTCFWGSWGTCGAPETSYIQVKKNSSASWHGRYHSYIYWKMEKKKEKEKETLALAPFI
jgi:hypothetical protein